MVVAVVKMYNILRKFIVYLEQEPLGLFFPAKSTKKDKGNFLDLWQKLAFAATKLHRFNSGNSKSFIYHLASLLFSG